MVCAIANTKSGNAAAATHARDAPATPGRAANASAVNSMQPALRSPRFARIYRSPKGSGWRNRYANAQTRASRSSYRLQELLGPNPRVGQAITDSDPEVSTVKWIVFGCATLVAACANSPPTENRSLPGAGQTGVDERREARALELAETDCASQGKHAETGRIEGATVYNCVGQ
jgi:hypothetical protein